MLFHRILETIPYDDWMPASEIASKIGEKSIDVAWIINRKLLNKYVERKRLSEKYISPYLYRRLKLISFARSRPRSLVVS